MCQKENALLTIRKYVVMLALSSALIIVCLSARADDLYLPKIFLKSDRLIGKTTEAVLATLGQPDKAAESDKNTGLYALGIRPLIWEYDDPDPQERSYGHSVKLIFLPSHILYGVVYNGLEARLIGGNGFSDLGRFALTQILKTYILSSFKVGYKEVNAKAMLSPGMPSATQSQVLFLVTAKTKSGNDFQTHLQAMSTNPLVLSHAFDASSGIYKDTYSNNPNFAISLDGGLNIGQLSMWSASLIKNKPGYFAYIKETNTGFSGDDPYMQFIRVTANIMPWLYSAQ